MAKTCFPLDDTNYLAKDLRMWHIGRTNGIINHTGDDFAVSPDTGMNVTLSEGYMYMYTGTQDPGGIIYGETEEQSLSGYVADAYVRYDYICIEYNAENNDAIAKFVKGTRDMPTPVRNETVYQNIVAVIRIKANASRIDQEDIIDTRMNEEYCGLAIDSLARIPTDQYYQQFMAFMQTIEGILGEDEAGNLLQQINQIKSDYIPKTDIVDNLTSGGTSKALSAEQGKVLKERDGVGKIIALGKTTCEYSSNKYLQSTIGLSGMNLQTGKHKVFTQMRYVYGSASELVKNITYTLNSDSLAIWLYGDFVNGHVVEVGYMIVESRD